MLVERLNTIEQRLRVVESLEALDTSATGALYLGDPATDGSWRITRSGNNLVIQRRESAVWTTKDTILA